MKKVIFFLFFLGLFLQIYLAAKSWVGGDQLHLLRLGMDLVQTGHFSGFAKLTEGGGTNVGCLLQVLVALPLFFWQNFRSPMILIVIFNILAYLIIAGEIYKIFDLKGVLIFTVIYWLSPIRLYNSGFLWEPAYIFLFAALHFSTARKLFEKKSFFYSACHVLIIILAAQIHNSSIILFFASIYLLVRGRIKINIYGVILGVFIGLLILIPTSMDLVSGNLPKARESSGYIFKGFADVVPFLKGIFYWLKSGGFDLFRAINETIFIGINFNWLKTVLRIISAVSIIFSIAANWFFFRSRLFKKYKHEFGNLPDNQKWLWDYVFAFFIALLLAAGLSPITLQGWMVMVALHAAMFPMVWLLMKFYDGKFTNYKTLLLGIYIVVQVATIIFISAGQEKFNRTSKIPNNLENQKDSELPIW